MARRSIAYVWISLALFIAALYIVLHVFVMRSFSELEKQNTSRNVARLLDVVDDRVRSLDAKASDWAAWDDAYRFMQDRNGRFIASNIVLSAFTGVHLNLIAYFDNSGRLVYGRWYNTGADRIVPIPPQVVQALHTGDLLSRRRDPLESVRGILMLKQGPMLVASRPVVTSHEQGPMRGSLVFGRLLAGEIGIIVRVTRVPIVVQRLDVGRLPADFARAEGQLRGNRKIAVQATGRDVVSAYAIVKDIQGQPALMLRIDRPRTFYNRGLTLSNYALAALIGLSVVFGSIVSLLLVRAVQKEREFDLRTVEFYRSTIVAATNGKLFVTDRAEIERMCQSPMATWRIRVPTDVTEVREKVLQTAESSGMDKDRAWTFATCVGEAVTNAIKHAGGGSGCLRATSDELVFTVTDQGPGIPALTLPDVALRRGYSTAGTLGMGYKIMVAFSDRLYLATDANGTAVAIEMSLQPPHRIDTSGT